MANPGAGRLIIVNGDENGEHRVTSAEIFLNDAKILGANDFKKKDYILEVPVTLTAENSLRIKLKSKPGTFLNIRVMQEAAPPTVVIGANPETILAGESATLTWSSENADSVVIGQGFGTANLQGSVTVTPSETTTYTITATGSGGTATGSGGTATADITVYYQMGDDCFYSGGDFDIIIDNPVNGSVVPFGEDNCISVSGTMDTPERDYWDYIYIDGQGRGGTAATDGNTFSGEICLEPGANLI